MTFKPGEHVQLKTDKDNAADSRLSPDKVYVVTRFWRLSGRGGNYLNLAGFDGQQFLARRFRHADDPIDRMIMAVDTEPHL